MFNAATIALVGWGALAFGAEYAWAYAPLLVFCVVAGILGLRASRGTSFPSWPVLLALALTFLAGAFQVLPWPWSPGHVLAVDYGRLYTAVTLQQLSQPVAATALSIAPGRTMLGLGFLASLTTLLVGCTRGLSAAGPRLLLRSLVILGVVVAFVGIIQAAVQSETIYGLWHEPKAGIPFAPFINKNHFAGWMVMAMSLAIGWFVGGVANALNRAAPRWRDRVLWLSSPQASETVLSAAAVAVMALSMVLTFSRGGFLGLVLALAVSLWSVLRRQRSRSRRLAGAASLAAILIAATAWGGADRTLNRFRGSELDWGGRRGVWQDTWHIIREHPLAGTGLNTFGIAMLHYQTGPLDERFVEAHNDYLQLASEGGLLLGLPILLLLVMFIREVWRRFDEKADDERTYWLRAGAVTGLISIAGMEIFDFTLQMPGAAVLFVVLVAIAIHRPDYLNVRSNSAT